MPRTTTLQLHLTDDERLQARRLLKTGRHKSRSLQRLAILLKWDEGLSAKQIAAHLPVTLATVYKVFHRYHSGKLPAVAPISNMVDGVERADPHGIAVRVK